MPSQINGMEDTIRILVATDNHVGYSERDPVRGDDSWKAFHEIMCMAKDRDVDMVLLGGDLFHENVPSRKSMYNVMRSLRLNCYGDKPCEIEILSDSTEHFDATIGHANYEDTNINVAIPVFSIHGNHDDPSGDGHFAALDILEMSGLINYFGRVPQSDSIHVRPLLLQKGNTKLALYGLSNVRDERMYQSFKDNKVTFYQSKVQQKDWYNIAVVHQNHEPHTATTYLPENFLPSFLDLVVWGHEHECKIEPRLNAEMNFKVMQPGSSVATSLAMGEAVTKHVAILSVTGRQMNCEPIRLKTVRPFIYKEIVLANEKAARKIAQKDGHRHKLTDWLMGQVEELIAEAQKQWVEAQETESAATEDEQPLPLIRLRVEHSSVDGIKFEVENPQRFSNRFTGRVANNHDIIQVHVKKRSAAAARIKASEAVKELMDKTDVAENIKVNKLVSDFLAAQSLTILPQNYFGDAVNQYIDKDDKHAMDLFINDSLAKQIRNLVSMNEEQDEEDEEEDLIQQFDAFKSQMEEDFKKGNLKRLRSGGAKYKPKPAEWESDKDGDWETQPAAFIAAEEGASEEDMVDNATSTLQAKPMRSSHRVGRGAGGTRGRGGTTKKKTAKAAPRGRKKVTEDDSDDGEDDVVMLDEDEEEEEDAGVIDVDSDSQAMFFSEAAGKKGGGAKGSMDGSRAGSVTSITASKSRAKPAPTTRKAPVRAAASRDGKQSTLNFSTSQASVFGNGGRNQNEVSEIEDDEDDDAFEPMSTTRTTRSKR